MSGPKDFNIIYAAIRAWQIQQRMKREAEIRAAALANSRPIMPQPMIPNRIVFIFAQEYL